MGCLRQREILYIIANSSLLLLGHTYFKSESRLRSWQRSWPCWNQWLFYPGIQLGQAFISGIFPWTCLFSVLFFQSVVFLFLPFSFPPLFLWKCFESLLFFVEQYTIICSWVGENVGKYHFTAELVRLDCSESLCFSEYFCFHHKMSLVFNEREQAVNKTNMPRRARSLNRLQKLG